MMHILEQEETEREMAAWSAFCTAAAAVPLLLTHINQKLCIPPHSTADQALKDAYCNIAAASCWPLLLRPWRRLHQPQSRSTLASKRGDRHCRDYSVVPESSCSRESRPGCCKKSGGMAKRNPTLIL